MKVVVFFATGYEEIEALAVVDVLRRAEVEVIMAGVEGKIVKSARDIGIEMDALVSEVDMTQVDMIVLPGGGKGVENLEKSEEVKMIIKDFKTQGKYIGAICAAPSLLGKMGILKGHRATCYPGFEKYLEEAYVNEEIVQSEKIITGVGAGVSLQFGLKLLEVLKGQEISEKIKKAMLIAK
jgi:4-methyl-5(b-hydroxyethyl)-thiazole monophosphate biosynthesis